MRELSTLTVRFMDSPADIPAENTPVDRTTTPDDSGSRARRLADIRAKIAAGTYETEQKLDSALLKMLNQEDGLFD